MSDSREKFEKWIDNSRYSLAAPSTEEAMFSAWQAAIAQQPSAVVPDDSKRHAVMQAQMWAQEARTQKAIVKQIGEIVGCANDWEMVEAVKAALASAVVPKWVSVKEDLPKSSDGLCSDPVIALADSGHAFTLSCMGNSWQRTYAFIADGATCVTHWMLFPALPKQDNLN
jgi:hypothetical protein